MEKQEPTITTKSYTQDNGDGVYTVTETIDGMDVLVSAWRTVEEAYNSLSPEEKEDLGKSIHIAHSQYVTVHTTTTTVTPIKF